MIFNTFQFIWCFPIIFVLYWLITGRKNSIYNKLSNALLIIISYALYIQWNPMYALLLLGITAITYFGAILVDKYNRNKIIIIISVIFAIFPLVLFKYYNFINEQISIGLNLIGMKGGLPGLNCMIPLGISFFSLQALGYLIDVYKHRIKAERNWWHYMLFVSFFPQIASGPISKGGELLPQIKSQRVFNYNQAVQGLKWLLWGMFLKVVVADHIGLQVDVVYQAYSSHTGLSLLITSLFYSMQVYCDFAGYSFMALGVGEIMGFELINNFQRPFFSHSITEFWRRWHISLSRWLKDYIYIPLGGSRCSKARNYFNIILTFIVSGLWHGANWTFIIWGIIHGLVQVVEKVTNTYQYKGNMLSLRLIRILGTYVVFSLSMIFFRMPSVEDALQVLLRIFTDFSGFPLCWKYCSLLVAIVIFKDLMDELDIKKLRLLHSNFVIIRWATYLLLILMIAISGVYGGQFIYSGF